jgi:hypothetical protein
VWVLWPTCNAVSHCSVATCLLWLQGLTFPLLENANEYIVHGFAYNDYLKEVEPPTAIGRVGASLDKAFASECGGQAAAKSACHALYTGSARSQRSCCAAGAACLCAGFGGLLTDTSVCCVCCCLRCMQTRT